MLDVGCWMLDVGCWMLGVGCWVLDAKKSILNVGTKIALGETAACLLLYTTNKKS